MGVMRPSVERCVKRLFAIYESGDLSRLEPLVADDVVAREHGGESVTGRHQLLARMREVAAGQRSAFTVHGVRGGDGCVLVSGRRRIAERHGHSDRPIYWVMRFDDGGTLLESTAFSSREDAERAFPVLC